MAAKRSIAAPEVIALAAFTLACFSSCPAKAKVRAQREIVRSYSRGAAAPTSSNGASSMHIFWDMPPATLIEVRATIEVLDPPPADRLVFWALQTGFADGRGQHGAGHFGLQHHPQYPQRCAINWGGYYSKASGRSGELPGSALSAPSALDNPNTCNFSWQLDVPYTYRIFQSPASGWRGSVIDPDGIETVVRDLHCDGDHLVSPMVWTESFAHCDDASSGVRWSNFVGVGSDGSQVVPRSVRLNFQTVADGGCSNTSTERNGNGFVQRTNHERVHSTGTRLEMS